MAAKSSTGTDVERQESRTRTKDLHRLTLRQGVFRLLDRLGLRIWKAVTICTRAQHARPRSRAEPGADYALSRTVPSACAGKSCSEPSPRRYPWPTGM